MAAQISGGSGSINSRASARNIPVKCNHEIPAIIRTCKNTLNFGKRFYGCSMWPGPSDCGFFQWELNCGAGPCSGCEDLQTKLLEQYTTVSDLELQFKVVEEKFIKLKLKKDKMEAALQEMKGEMMKMRVEAVKNAKGEKYAMIGLGLSWLLFVIVAVFLA